MSSTVSKDGLLVHKTYRFDLDLSMMSWKVNFDSFHFHGEIGTWEIGRFSMKTRRYVGKRQWFPKKLHSESTRNILLNEGV